MKKNFDEGKYGYEEIDFVAPVAPPSPRIAAGMAREAEDEVETVAEAGDQPQDEPPPAPVTPPVQARPCRYRDIRLLQQPPPVEMQK